MKKYSKFFLMSFVFLMFVMSLFIGISAAKYRLGDSKSGAVRTITHVRFETDTGVSGVMELPKTLRRIAPKTSFTLTTKFAVGPGEALLIKSVFLPMEVFINGELAWEYGQVGSYIPFLNDPPTALLSVPLPLEGGEISLRIHLRSPTQRRTLVLPAIHVGKSVALLQMQFTQDGFIFIFSLLLIALGFVFIVVSLRFIREIPSAASFLWLGIFYLATGSWGFGECDLTVLLLPYPSLLYVMSYLGLFFLAIPLLRFSLLVTQPKNRLPARLMLWMHGISISVAIWLQLSSLADFTKTLYWFLLITPLSFLILTISILRKWRDIKRPVVKLLFSSILFLIVLSLVEMLNYELHFVPVTALFFEIGLLGFLFLLTVVSGYYMQDSLRTATEKEQLAFQMKAVNQQLALQRIQFQKIAESDVAVKSQRHDLRHHLTVLRELYEQNDREKLGHYLKAVNENLPSGRGPALCDNYAVNAVASHYADMAERMGAEVSMNLVVPAELPSELECDLCVIVGNLMENAAEACARMTEDHRFVRVSSHLLHGILTIVVDNSFNEPPRKRNDAFLSSKREGEGIGLKSVLAVAKRHGGNAQFEWKDGVFQASAYVRLDSALSHEATLPPMIYSNVS
ncbi:MAG: GHKL domain-containing protein [Clostridiaceae bacterium]|nr:GHKL domain-containing protein [Clostridiaceae bacterium]